jgi:cytochrome oxidase Cu insertion factor (SCO1/SenC/PrrC family)
MIQRIARTVAFCALCIVLVASAQVAPSEPARADAARLMNELMAGNVPVGGPFTLTDQDGHLVGPEEWRGKVSLVYFGYMFCPDACPAALSDIGAAIEALGALGARVQPVFVTLDPKRDMPKLRGDYARSFNLRFLALGGTEDEVRRVALAYKVFFEKVPLPGPDHYLIDHTSFTYVLDSNGQYVGYFPPGTSGNRMAEQLRGLLADKS